MASAYCIEGRTACMRNRFEVRGDVTVIFLPRHNLPDAECLIDTEDLPLVRLFSWSYSNARKDRKHEYARSTTAIRTERGGKYSVVMMHRLIMQSRNPHLKWIDHIDHNGMNNRQCNLRVASATLNSLNRADTERGVSKVGKGWFAAIGYRGSRVSLGMYDSQEEARLVFLGARRFAECLEQRISAANVPSVPSISVIR